MGLIKVSVIQKLRQKRIKMILRNATFVLEIFRKDQFSISHKNTCMQPFLSSISYSTTKRQVKSYKSAVFTKGMVRLKSKFSANIDLLILHILKYVNFYIQLI